MSPQATPELRAKFPGGDSEAMEVLKLNFEWGEPKPFIIRKKNPNYEPTQREWDAVDYLFHEWDWGYGLN